MERVDIAFDAEGTILRGWLVLPAAGDGPWPAVVMAHGFSAVKEQYLDRFAAAFAAAGLAAVVFDHAGFGASDGTSRDEIDPWRQIRDYRHAITYARTLDRIDPARIGIWGTSYSGGHVLVVGAIDRRVRCVVSQVPTISGSAASQRRIRADQLPAVLARFDADRVARFRGEPPETVAVVSDDPTTPCALAGADAFAFFDGSRAFAPAWRNAVTLRTLEMAREYEPGVYVSRISPTPLLMIVADHDTITPTDLALAAYAQALEPKRLVLVPGGHFEPYVEHFATASGAAAEWLSIHLGAAR
ncbi:MAG: alpha/beta hydrolase [Chromatiales bacterium]|nr:alpha/beta hydrolase [Chromatiales bacterium]